MVGLDLEVAGATSSFTAVAAALGLPPGTALGGTDLLTMVALADLNVAATADAASTAVSVSDQMGAGATGSDNVTTYVGTDSNNAANLSDTGVSTVTV